LLPGEATVGAAGCVQRSMPTTQNGNMPTTENGMMPTP
jgi:hypothetical protein